MQKVIGKMSRFFNGKWNLAVLDMEKGRWILDGKTRFIPYLKAENANGRHILIRPAPEIESDYLMADDISESLLSRHHKLDDESWRPGRMIVETSPKNYQVWIHSSRRLSLDEKRYWLNKMRSDPGADPNNRWGRCPGFRNRKEKYRDHIGGYPLARLIWVDWARKADIPPVHVKYLSDLPIVLSPQPRGVVCHKIVFPESFKKTINSKSICRNDYIKQDESATDMAYALALARRQFSRDQIRSRLLSERNDWKNHVGNRRINAYLERTIRKALYIIQYS